MRKVNLFFGIWRCPDCGTEHENYLPGEIVICNICGTEVSIAVSDDYEIYGSEDFFDEEDWD